MCLQKRKREKALLETQSMSLKAKQPKAFRDEVAGMRSIFFAAAANGEGHLS